MPTYKKYFKHKFLLNGVELDNVSIGASAIGKFEEPLDEAGLHLPFTMRDYEYPMRGLLQIISEDYKGKQIDTTYIILSDEVEEGSKYGEWKHNIHVMEYSGKYDSYLYHTFTYTKALKNKNPAPFIILDNPYIASSSSPVVDIFIFLKPLFISTTYFSDENIVIPQVEQALQATYPVLSLRSEYATTPVLVKIDGDVSKRHVLSESDFVFQLDEGEHYIDYGFVTKPSFEDETGGNDVFVYRFYINVIPKAQLSLLDALNIIRDSKPFESKLYHESTRLFNIDENIEDYLASVELPQMFLQKATMRQILNTMFSYINAISRFTYNSEDIDTLSMDEFNKVIGSFDIQDVVAFSSNQEAIGLYNQGVVWGERMLPTSFEEETITSPAQNLYKTVRSTQIQLTDGKFGIPLEAELYQPVQLSVMLDWIAYTPDAEATVFINNFPLDLTARFINREEWLLKQNTTNFPTPSVKYIFDDDIGLRENRVSNLYWTKGSKEIDLSEFVGEVLQTNLVFSTIQEASHELISRNYGGIIEPFTYYSPLVEKDVVITRYSFGISPSVNTSPSVNYKNLKFQLKYITFESFPFQTHRENTTNSLYYTEGRLNQSDKAMNISFASMRAHGDTQRSGVPSISFTKLYEDYQDILRWGMKDSDDFIIVEEKFEYHNEFVKATYTATKDHNRLSLWTKVDQEYRWQEIPSSNQVFERQELFNENIVITNPNFSLTEQLTMISDVSLDLIFGTLMNEWKDSITEGKTKVTIALVRTDGFSEYYPDEGIYKNVILTPVRSFGGKHGFSFVFGFDGNQVAGDALEFDGTNYYNKAIRYTNENGEFTTLWFVLATKFILDGSGLNDDGYTDAQRYANYPFSRVNEEIKDTNFVTHQSGSMEFDDEFYNGLMFGKKDKSQSIKLGIQTSVFPYDYTEYVFGTNFYSNNFIVNNPETEFDEVIGTSLFFYPYIDGTQYDKFSVYKIKTTHGTPKLLVNGENVSFVKRKFRFSGDISLTGLTSWAIGDEFGNLYLACNKPYNGFNASRQHFYPNQIQVGNKLYVGLQTDEIFGEAEIKVVAGVGAIGYIYQTLSSNVEFITASIVQAIGFERMTLYGNTGIDGSVSVSAVGFIKQISSDGASISSVAEVSVEGFIKQVFGGSIGLTFTAEFASSGYILQTEEEDITFTFTADFDGSGYIYEFWSANTGESASTSVDASGYATEIAEGNATLDGVVDVDASGEMQALYGTDWEVTTNTNYTLSIQDTNNNYNSSLVGCATESNLELLLPSASSYEVGTIARVRVNFADIENSIFETCSTWEYFIVV